MLAEHVLVTFMSIAICDKLYPTVSAGTYIFTVFETNRTT